MKLVIVKWFDACSFDEWHSRAELRAKINDIHKEAETITTGFLYDQNENIVVLVQNYQGETEATEENLSGIMIIPRGMIRDIVEVEIAREGN